MSEQKPVKGSSVLDLLLVHAQQLLNDQKIDELIDALNVYKIFKRRKQIEIWVWDDEATDPCIKIDSALYRIFQSCDEVKELYGYFYPIREYKNKVNEIEGRLLSILDFSIRAPQEDIPHENVYYTKLINDGRLCLGENVPEYDREEVSSQLWRIGLLPDYRMLPAEKVYILNDDIRNLILKEIEARGIAKTFYKDIIIRN